jgi:hypothetical protein
MKLLSEYLERSIHFERMAAEPDNAAIKEQLLKQAGEYRQLAENRASQLGLPVPPPNPPPRK